MKNKTFRLVFRTVLLLIALIALVTTFTDHAVSLGGDGVPTALYYTTWSVWFAALSAVLVYIETIRGTASRWVSLLKFCAAIMIIATFIVAAFVLPDKLWTAGYWTFGSIFKHFLLPVVTVLDCALFDGDRDYGLLWPLWGGVAPLAYWVILICRIEAARASFGGAIAEADWSRYYPYTFTNFDNGHTLGGLCGLLAGILVGLIAIGYVFVLCNRRGKKKQ